MKTIIGVLSIVVLMAAPMAFAEEAAKPGDASPPASAPPPMKYDAEGAPMPPIEMKKVADGGIINLAKLAGKPALFIFMNSSCTACRAEISALSKTAEKYKEKVTPYVVTVDFDPTMTPKRYPDLAAMPYILLDGSDYKVATALGFNFTPATLVVDKSGKQAYRHAGFKGGDEMEVFKAIVEASK